MTKEEFDGLKMGDEVVLKGEELFGKPVRGKVSPSYLLNIDAASKWTFSVNGKRLNMHWTPASNEEFMRKIDRLN